MNNSDDTISNSTSVWILVVSLIVFTGAGLLYKVFDIEGGVIGTLLVLLMIPSVPGMIFGCIIRFGFWPGMLLIVAILLVLWRVL